QFGQRGVVQSGEFGPGPFNFRRFSCMAGTTAAAGRAGRKGPPTLGGRPANPYAEENEPSGECGPPAPRLPLLCAVRVATMTTAGSDPWFQSLFADRIGGASYGKGNKIYKFEKIKRARRAALAAHPERRLLDFGIGENDDMADPLVREVLKREVDRLENRGYADNGIAAFKEAAAGVYQKVVSV